MDPELIGIQYEICGHDCPAFFPSREGFVCFNDPEKDYRVQPGRECLFYPHIIEKSDPNFEQFYRDWAKHWRKVAQMPGLQ